MKRYPLKLSYITKTALWGGRTLADEWGKKSEFDVISESWELTVRDKEMSKIVNGDAAGLTLAEYFDRAGYDAVAGDFAKGDRFPLLIKLIDACDKLSLQVHPDDRFACEVENDLGKTEMWYIVSAEEGASIIYGLRCGVTEEDFASAVRENRTSEVVKTVPVRAGESYFIPSGMVHAIGRGILIAEIQQNSDLTYRVYDYDRVGADGKKRELHVDKAIAVTKVFAERDVDDICYSEGRGGADLLANCNYFKVKKLCLKNGDGAELCANEDSFLSLLAIDGEGEIIFEGESYPIKKGDSYFLPASMGECTLCGSLEVLVSSL
jgi:mannose-6-phosphate isomerase